jgi:two-component system nitrogen regulation response regulator NtrX
MALEVLVVDDEADIRELVSGVLEDEGYAVRTAANSTATLDAIEDRRPSMVLLDVWLQGSRLDGLQLLQEIKHRDPTIPVLMISGHGNLDTAVAAVREGAIDFIEKPFEAERLIYLVGRATETDRLRRENVALKAQVGAEDQLQGSSVAINTVRATLKRVAPTGSRVLISGPAGVGKEIAARMIHQWSPRSAAPFIVLSAAMMSPDRVEEELFGSEAEGVVRSGLLEHAHGGTLFLDEIAELPLALQAKLLRALQEGEVLPVGATHPVPVNVRVIAACNRDLAIEAEAGRFRADLYWRLNVMPLHLRPLAERAGDIMAITAAFLLRHQGQAQGMAALTGFAWPTTAAMARLAVHAWPGNARELGNVLQRAIVLREGDRIETGDLSIAGASAPVSMPEPQAPARLQDVARASAMDAIRAALRDTGGHRARAARLLGISERTLRYRLAEMRDLAMAG